MTFWGFTNNYELFKPPTNQKLPCLYFGIAIKAAKWLQYIIFKVVPVSFMIACLILLR